MQALDVGTIFKSLQEELKWRWHAGRQGGEYVFDAGVVAQALQNADLVGYLNFIHPHQISVLGKMEETYFKADDGDEHVRLYEGFYSRRPPAIVLAEGIEPTDHLIHLCEKYTIPLLITDVPASYVIDVLHTYLLRYFAQKLSVHGVFMDILGVGVLIQGEAGIGKSELGLDLISRGHRLVADDVVDFSLIRPGVIDGECPELLENLLEVRGIGLLNVRTIFGERAMRKTMQLQLIVKLLRRDLWEQCFERLPVEPLTQNILGLSVREIVIPVQAGRNIAVLVEAAVRNTMLQMQGVDAYQEFVFRQKLAMQKN